MRKTISIVLIILLMLSLAACGKSKAAQAADELIAAIGEVTLDSGDAITEAEKAVDSLESKDREALENEALLIAAREEYNQLVAEEEQRKEEERIFNLVTGGPWFGVFDGDQYTFCSDGTGTHDKVTIQYSISDGVIDITEGVAGMTHTKLILNESDGSAKLFTEDGKDYYVDQATYDEISAAIQAEYTAELVGHEAWAVSNGGAFVMYFMFNDKGGGWAVFYGGTYSLKWEFVDNDTIKVTIITNMEQTATYDIIVENSDYKLVQTNNSAVVATPHN